MSTESKRKVSWPTIRDLSISKSLNLQYIEESGLYFIFLTDNGFLIFTNLNKTVPESVDQLDFENNYKANANQRLTNQIIGSNRIDPLNSSVSPLEADAVFTGQSEEVLNYSMIVVFLKTDQPSADLGLQVQWSSDGINWDDFDAFTIIANSGRFFTFGPQGRFYRVVYTNGPIPQGFFRLQTILKSNFIKPSSHRIDDSITGENDAELVKSVLTGKNPDLEFVNEVLTGKDSDSSTTALLGSGGIFVGPIKSAIGYNSIVMTVNSDQPSASVAWQIIWYNDSAGLEGLAVDPFTYTTLFFGQSIVTRVKGPFYKIQYTNGSTPQTHFRLFTYLSTNPVIGTIASGASIPNGLQDSVYVRPVNDRLYNVANRTFFKKFLTGATLVGGGGTVIHTVTSGKTFYMTNYSVTAVSNNATVPQFVLQDSTDATDRIPFIFQPQPALSVQGVLNAQQNMEQNPIPYTTDVRTVLLAGAVTASITIWGYEE